jgi:site-specific DNA-methyltransferase (adenine-specific)
MEGMKEFPDKHFELAIVDPPYGIDFSQYNRTNKDKSGNRFKADLYKQGDWDNEIPRDEYFIELFRCSKNQIIWGGNYFPFLWQNGCKGFIFWYKGQPVENFSDGELAWTSFNKVARQINYRYYGNLEGKSSAKGKIHPTQKPVALYSWLLKNYANPGDKILDTHLGSGSSRIAAYKMGFDFTGYELDKEYFDDQEKRFKEAINEPLFNQTTTEQGKLL